MSKKLLLIHSAFISFTVPVKTFAFKEFFNEEEKNDFKMGDCKTARIVLCENEKIWIGSLARIWGMKKGR